MDGEQTTRGLEPLSFRAAIAPGSLNAEARTAEVVWTTGARVLRGFFEPWFEELSLDPRHVRMGRLQSGRAPLLDSHDGTGGAGAVLGVVESAHLEAGRGVARVRFAKDDPSADAVWNKIQQGVLRNVSVGYRTYKLEKQTGGEGETPIYRATDWEPFELSVVPMGADAGAAFRAAGPTNRCAIITPRTRNMDENTHQTEAPEVLAERQRIATIHNLATRFRLSDGFAQELIARGTPLDQARAAIIDQLAERDAAIRTEQHVRVEEGGGLAVTSRGRRDGGDGFVRAAVDAVLIRAGIPVKAPHADAASMSASVYDLARTALSRAGVSSGLSRGPALLKRALSTSDFPAILAGSLHASLRIGYETEPASHRLWVRTQMVNDFRQQNRPILGSAPDLKAVGEGGEYPFGPMTDDLAKYTVSKYGVRTGLTDETLINDNLGAFLRMQPALGQAARRKEADTVYALFAANSAAGPTMQDGTNLFDAAHANLTAAGAFDSTLLATARSLLRKQTALGGGYLSLVPRYWIIPAERETAAEVIMANATRRVTTEKATPEWIANLTLVIEPRLPNNAAYLAAGFDQIDTVELGVLDASGSEGGFIGGVGPTIETERDFAIDQMSWKVRHVFGAAALDFRGLTKMPISP